MKLVIQIPAYNEEETLAETLQALPRELEGIDEIFVLVIDDGSTDRTVEIAIENGVDAVLSNSHNMGLAITFVRGLDAALQLGADIIVNTDGDNQYCADDIPALIKPLLAKRAEVVIGARNIQEMVQFSPLKKFLHAIGNHRRAVG